MQPTLMRAQRGRRADTTVVPRQHTGVQFHAQMGCSRDVQVTRILHGFRRRCESVGDQATLHSGTSSLSVAPIQSCMSA